MFSCSIDLTTCTNLSQQYGNKPNMISLLSRSNGVEVHTSQCGTVTSIPCASIYCARILRNFVIHSAEFNFGYVTTEHLCDLVSNQGLQVTLLTSKL
jgi:hypothetical protein